MSKIHPCAKASWFSFAEFYKGNYCILLTSMKKRKLYNYQFRDKQVQWPAMVKCKCTITGKEVSFYHKYLFKLINTKYNGDYTFFETTYKSKGSNDHIKEVQRSNGIDPDDTSTPETYRKYLVTMYRYLKEVTGIDEMDRLDRLEKIKNDYFNRWGTTVPCE